MGNNIIGAYEDQYDRTKVGDEESGWFFTVLEYCDIKTRCNATFLCKRYFKLLSSNASFRWRLERLHIEQGIYCSKVSNCINDNDLEQADQPNFKNIYLDLIRHRLIWFQNDDDVDADVDVDVDDVVVSNDCPNTHHDNVDEQHLLGSTHLDSACTQDEELFNIHVSVRFKPLDGTNAREDHFRQRQVTLPLHQRLALIKHRNKLNSNSDALNVLKQEGEWFKEKWSLLEKENLKNQEELNGEQMKSKSNHGSLSCGVQSLDSNSVVIVDPTKGLRNFVFDQVLADSCNQDRVYETSAQPLIQDFINGTNACCLVYGVTGSGKTYTMFGPHDRISIGGSSLPHNLKDQGIVPKACREIFDVLEYREKKINLNIEAQVSISYIEIFGSEISDLLRKGKLCSSNKAASQRFVLSGASECKVRCVQDVEEALEKGERQKRKASTAMNDRSSRAHTVVIVSLKQVCEETGVSRTSRLFLADLGGCEQTKKSNIVSGASKHFEKLKESILQTEKDETTDERFNQFDRVNVVNYSTGFVQSDRMREAVYINLGLMALKACVTALISNAKYIPYSDSKLTMMLSSALGGNSKTSVIVCAAQDKHLIRETIAALKFGQSCRDVSNAVQSETDFLRKLIDDLDAQISHCQDEIRKKERWEVREEKRKDVLAESDTLESKGFGGIEVRKTTILVGAEKEHEQLKDLIQQRAQLTGVSISTDNEESNHKYGGEMGFGNAHAYGLGKKFDNSNVQSDYRFGKAIDSDVPESVRSAVGENGDWKGEDASLSISEKCKLQSMTKRSGLVYSGISA